MKEMKRKAGVKPSVKKDEKEEGTVKKALERDLEQTKHDLSFGKAGKDLDQDVDDTVKQAAGKEPVPPRNVPNPD